MASGPYLFYPGCSLEGTARDYAESVRAVARALDLDLRWLDNWECCGASVAKSVDARTADLLPAANLARAGTSDPVAQPDLVTACPACYQNHRRVAEKTATDSEFPAWANATLNPRGLHLVGVPRVRHFLEVLVYDVSPDDLQARIQRPLREMRVVPYYGCLLVRPYRLGGVESREAPTALERLIEMCGAVPLPFAARTDCCGGAVLLSRESVAVRLTAKILAEALEFQPDCLVVACPLCHFMLDAKQRAVERVLGKRVGLPVLYFTQLLGLALNLNPRSLGLHRAVFPARSLLRNLGHGEAPLPVHPPSGAPGSERATCRGDQDPPRRSAPR